MRSVGLAICAVGCVDRSGSAGPFSGTDGGPTESAPAVSGAGSVGVTSVADDDQVPAIVDQVVPMVGGSIAVGAEFLAAADPDGDALAVVKLDDGSKSALLLEDGSAPAVVAWTATDEPELVHALLRGNGTVVVVEPRPDATPVLLAQRSLCAAPRGLAWDVDRELMWVACAGGELVGTTREGEPVAAFVLEPDLRDVVVLADGRAMISRVRAAEVLVVDLDDGDVQERWMPRDQIETNAQERVFVPRVLRRLVSTGGAVALALYQAHDTGRIELGSSEDGSDGAYGGSAACSSVVRTVESTVSPETGFGEPTLFDAQRGFVVDLVPNGSDFPILVTMENFVVAVHDESNALVDEPCVSTIGVVQTSAVPAGLALDGADTWVVTREPFFVGTTFELSDKLPPGTDALADRTGLELFHDAPDGVACASCHFEGGEDGHVWRFSTGARRTQSLGGLVISETAPFHWNGDLATFDDLFDDTAVDRMGMDPLDDTTALTGFLDRLPRPPVPAAVPDAELVAEGALLFGDPVVGCAGCHSGWRYSNGLSADVGTGGLFQVPSLVGVASRLPLMHDGCASLLRQRFDDPSCGGTQHGDTSGQTSAQIDALVAFLETL